MCIRDSNIGNSHSTEQALRLAVGDNNAVISTSNTSGGLHFFVNRGTTAMGYQVNTGTQALHLANTGAATFASTITAQGISSTSGTVSFADGGSSFDSSDAQGYARFTHAGGSAQIGLFRSSNSIGGVHIGGDSGGFHIYASTDAAGTFGNEILDLDMSGNLQIDGLIDSDGTGTNSFAGNIALAATPPNKKI